MAMDTALALFRHELLDTYDAEHQLTSALPKLADEVSDEQLAAGFRDHLEQTRGHIARIEKVCALLGIEAEREQCPGMAGLIKEHDRFLREDPSSPVLNVFDIGAAQKTEHYEIVSYKGLISMAGMLGNQDVVQLLQENLSEEEAMAARLEGMEKWREETLMVGAR